LLELQGVKVEAFETSQGSGPKGDRGKERKIHIKKMVAGDNAYPSINGDRREGRAGRDWIKKRVGTRGRGGGKRKKAVIPNGQPTYTSSQGRKGGLSKNVIKKEKVLERVRAKFVGAEAS